MVMIMCIFFKVNNGENGDEPRMPAPWRNRKQYRWMTADLEMEAF